MSLSVRDLVAQPHLRLEVMAGAAGLDRKIIWAHSSDLSEPWDWLAGGELLMKNGRSLPRPAAGQEALLTGLADAGVSALVIGSDPLTPPLSARAVARADELRLPVLRVPYSMSFIVLSRAVADASMHDEAERLARASRVYAAIHVAVAGTDPAAFLQRLERELGGRLYVVDSGTAAPVLDGTTAPPAQVRSSLRATLAQRGGAVPGLLRLGKHRGQALAAVEIPYEEPTLLIVQQPRNRRLDLALLQHAAAAIAVELAHASLRQDHQRQAGTELLAQLMDSRTAPGSARRQLAALGIDPAQARMLAASGPSADRRPRLHTGLHRRGIAHLVLHRETIFWVLADDRRPAAGLAEVVQSRLGPGTLIGVSDPLGAPDRVPDAAREARWALGAAARQPGGVACYDQAPLPSALRDPAEARALVDRTLGALLAYDHATGSDLVHSLAVFLACRRSWQRTARSLSVHRQTVMYRMRRVSELTGRTLADTADLAEFWLALSALELLTGQQLAGPAAAPRRPGVVTAP